LAPSLHLFLILQFRQFADRLLPPPFGLFTNAPGAATMVGVNKESEYAAARCALKIMFKDISGPRRFFFDVFQAACSLKQSEFAAVEERDDFLFQAMILLGRSDFDRFAEVVTVPAHKSLLRI